MNRVGFELCTPVQEVVIPEVLAGRDVAGLAQTGTGKTAAFLLPLMERILRAQGLADASETQDVIAEARAFPGWRQGDFVLVLVPTRELASQVYEEFYRLRGDSKLEAVSVIGGTAYHDQRQGLQDEVEFVIGTPGRLIDLFKGRSLDLRRVRAVVFDEADRMFDMGFKKDMVFLLQRIPAERQFLVFSATLNFDVMNTAYRFGADPVEFNLSRDEIKAENVEDIVFHVGQQEKPLYLLSVVSSSLARQIIVFSNYKSQVNQIVHFLSANGRPAVGISSELSQAQRNRVMAQFKNEENDKNILVATDVAARGLDLLGVDLIVLFDLPEDAESYVHRIGRTGRAGAIGKAVSLCSDRDWESLVRIEKFLQQKLPVGWLEDGEMVQPTSPYPRRSDFGDRGRGGPRRDSSGPRRDSSGPRRDSSGPRRDSSGPRGDTGGPRRDDRGPRRDAGEGRPRPERSEGGNAAPAAAQSPRPDDGNARGPGSSRPPRPADRRNTDRGPSSAETPRHSGEQAGVATDGGNPEKTRRRRRRRGGAGGDGPPPRVDGGSGDE